MNEKGRQFKGGFAVTKTEEEAKAESDEAATMSKDPNAIDLDTYLAVKGIRGEVTKAAMQAYTKVRMAPLEKFDEIFKNF